MVSWEEPWQPALLSIIDTFHILTMDSTLSDALVALASHAVKSCALWWGPAASCLLPFPHDVGVLDTRFSCLFSQPKSPISSLENEVTLFTMHLTMRVLKTDYPHFLVSCNQTGHSCSPPNAGQMAVMSPYLKIKADRVTSSSSVSGCQWKWGKGGSRSVAVKET